MNYLSNNQQKMTDLIFAGRNKNYGAYVLRSTYGNTVFKSLAIMILGFGTIIGLAYVFARQHQTTPMDLGQLLPPDIHVLELDLKPRDLAKRTNASTPSANKSKTTTQSTVVKDTLIAQTNTVAINVDVETPSTGTSTIVASIPTTGGTSTGAFTAEGTSSNTVMAPYGVDSQPEFEGGLSALYKFLASKLRYPTAAQELGIGGTVYVKFVVDESGKVDQLNLLNARGYGMDEEALRVVAMIPNFKTPAKVQGKAVKVYYQVPIKFTMGR
jgi:periplasmic protein TonB